MQVRLAFRRNHGRILAAVLLCIVLMVSAATAWAENGKLGFLTEDTLELGDPLPSDYLVALSNSSPDSVHVTFEVVALRDPEGKPSEGALSVSTQSTALGGYSIADFELKFSKTGGDLPDGTYQGFLVAKAGGVGPAYRPLTWKIGEDQAPADGSLAFLDTETLVLQGSGAQTAQEALENSEKGDVADIQFRVVALHDPEGGYQREIDVDVKGVPDTLKRQSTEAFELTFSPKNLLPPGVHEGFLVATGAGIKPAHKPLKWEVSHSTLSELVPEAEALTFEGTLEFWSPINRLMYRRSKLGTQALKQWAPSLALTSLQLYGEDVENQLSTQNVDPLHAILRTEDNREAKVELSAPDPLSKTTVRATLRLMETIEPGKYSGSLFLTPTDPVNSRKVTIVVLVRDHPFWPGLLIFLGLCLSHCITRWRTRWRPGLDTEGQAQSKLDQIEKDHSQFIRKRAVEPTPLTKYSILEAAGNQVTDLKDLVKKGKLDEARKKLEALGTFFEAYRTFRASAVALYNSSKELVKETSPSSAPEPQVAVKVKAFFAKAEPIKDAGALANLTTQVEELRRFCALFLHIWGRWKLGQVVRNDLDKETIKSGYEDMWVRAVAQLDGVREDLWRAKSSQQLDRWQVERMAESALRQLRIVYEATVPTPQGAAVSWNRTWQNIAETVGHLLDMLANLELAPLPVTVPPKSPKQRALEIRRFVRWTDVLLIAVGWVVAVLTAMWALYVGKSFGTGWDYLAAFLWGSGVDQGLKGLSNVLGKLTIAQPGK